METVIVRLELSPECAAAIERVLEQALASADTQLGQDPPQHTKKALTTMREHIDSAARELARASANPIAVEIPDADGAELPG